MDFIKWLSWCMVVLLFASGTLPAIAQQADDAPIYLDEPEPEPPAKVSARKNLKETYKDKTPRTERDVAKLSNDKVVNDGKYIEYYPDGEKYTEGTYKMGVFDGEWQYWFPNGQLCKKVTFKKGKPDGQWEVFNKEGKRTAQKGYQNGKRHGKWLNYHEGGEKVKFEVSYDLGQPVGQRITYYENGQKRQEIGFKEGKFHGMMTEWDETGKKLGELEFVDGARKGKVVRFDK